MRRRDCRGGSTSIAYLGLIPFLLLLIFGGLQLGMMYHAHLAATAAARSAADQARLMPAGDGQGAASTILGNGAVLNPVVAIDRGATTVTVTVTGDVPRVLWKARAHGQVTYPVERVS